MSDIFLASLGIFFAELYGNFVGGGSIVTQFVLQGILDMDLKSAIALDNAAVLGSEMGLALTLLRKNRVGNETIFFLFPTILGSVFGAHLLQIIPIEILKFIFTGTIFFVLIKIFFEKENSEKRNFFATPKNLFFLAISGSFIGAYNAFLSIGDFTIGLLLLISFFHFSYQKALLLLSLSLVFGRSVATFEYFQFNLLKLDFLLFMFPAAMIAGIVVGFLADKIPTEKIKPVLKFLGLFLGIYLVISLF